MRRGWIGGRSVSEAISLDRSLFSDTSLMIQLKPGLDERLYPFLPIERMTSSDCGTGTPRNVIPKSDCKPQS